MATVMPTAAIGQGQEQRKVAVELTGRPHDHATVAALGWTSCVGENASRKSRPLSTVSVKVSGAAIGHAARPLARDDRLMRSIGRITARLPVACAHRVAELQRIASAGQHLRVAQCDLAGFAVANGKDASANQAVAGQLDQCGVFLPAHDFFIDAAGAGGIHGFTAQLLVALKEREVAEDGLARQRVDVIALAHGRAAILEPLLDFDTRYPAHHLHVDGGAQLS